MAKTPTKLGRIALRYFAIAGALIAAAILALLAYESVDPLEAAIWHMRHGNTVSFDGHQFHLPLSWYPDPGSNPGQLTLRHAQFGGITIDSVTLALRPRTLNEQAATSSIATETANLNKTEPATSDRWAPEILRGRTLSFHCTMSTTQGIGETLICQAANSNLTILATTFGRNARSQALDIIETSE